ncbi:MAG: HAMP domain-containing sensor histidine kinase, partial [Pirellulaceae bacterium]
DLTQTELLMTDDEGKLRNASVRLNASDASVIERQLQAWTSSERNMLVSLDRRPYRAMRFQRSVPLRETATEQIVILFDERQLRSARRQIAVLPLVTGLTTTVLLATITLLLTGRLIGRLSHLERQVDRIATGAFDTAIVTGPADEVGLLGASVSRMSAQLKQLWESIHRQQRQKLLHQIAGGMAHQLRNSLTGARMAVELHAESCRSPSDEGLHVAIQQMEQSEDFVRRLLQVGAGQQDRDQPASVLRCLQDVRASSLPIAKHRRKEMQWELDAGLDGWKVMDGSAFTAAITNLVLNALEIADCIEIEAKLAWLGDATASVTVRVTDNGPGIADAVGDQLFEPFVTSKREGLGLGLAVVKTAAEKLHGDVQYARSVDRTTFQFTAHVTAEAPH